ncbi:hypothetical protein C8R47DRAFT_1223484 [Mycena vitilis]|nr:hypothetical protein C8R47DRAFT_1223484 [Mycena vitilis]
MSEATEWDPEFYQAHAPRPFSAHDQKSVEIYSAQPDATRDVAERSRSWPVLLNGFDCPKTKSTLAPQRAQRSFLTCLISLCDDQPLQTGAGKFSESHQVWTDPEGTREGYDNLPEEAWSYERIAHKQGIFKVPYSFGLDTITTPSGESAMSGFRVFSDVCDVTDKLSVNAAEDFTSDGWVHVDLAARNILVTKSPGTHGVIFIDHFACRFASSDMKRVHVGRGLYLHIRQYLEFDLDFQRWATANIGMVAAVPILAGR